MKKPAEAKTILCEPSEISMGCKKIQGFSTLNSNDELFGKENGGGGRREFHRVSQGFTGFLAIRWFQPCFSKDFLDAPLQFLQKTEISGQSILKKTTLNPA